MYFCCSLIGTYVHSGIWLYPIFRTMTWNLRIVFVIVMYILAIFIYITEKLLTSYLWGKWNDIDYLLSLLKCCYLYSSTYFLNFFLYNIQLFLYFFLLNIYIFSLPLIYIIIQEIKVKVSVNILRMYIIILFYFIIFS